MPKQKVELTEEEQNWLETVTQEDLIKRHHKTNPNPSGEYWMIRTSRISTLDDHTVHEGEIAEKLKSCGAKAYVFQLERGKETGYEHFQIFCQFESKKRLSTLRKAFETEEPLIKFNWGETAYSIPGAISYCSKEDTRIHKTVFYGHVELPQRCSKYQDMVQAVRDGSISVDELMSNSETAQMASTHYRNLRELEATVLRMKFKNYTRNVKVIYIWGPTRSGKTRLAMDLTNDDAFTVKDYKAPFDSYHSESTIILDEFRDRDVKLTTLLGWLDSIPCEIHCRYTNSFAAWDTVYITSNISPYTMYKDEDDATRDALLARISEVWELTYNEDGKRICKRSHTPQWEKAQTISYDDIEFQDEF